MHVFLDTAGIFYWPSEFTRDRISDPGFLALRYLGRRAWDGDRYDVVEWRYHVGLSLSEDNSVYITTFFVDTTGVIRRIIERCLGNRARSLSPTYIDRGSRKEWVIADQAVNTIDEVSIPPVQHNVPVDSSYLVRPDSFVGRLAPSFALRDINGDTVRLRDILRHKPAYGYASVTIVDHADRIAYKEPQGNVRLSRVKVSLCQLGVASLCATERK